MFKKNLSFSLTLILIASLLSACGGGDTKIIERNPVPIDDGHDHGHDDDHDHDDESLTQGRLLISIKDQAKVSIIDIKGKELLEEFTLREAPSALYASPSYRYGYVVQRTADLVNVIDSGLSQADHGDHKDDVIAAPMMMSFHTNGSRPTHFTDTHNQSVIFYDGNAATTTPASVGVYTESDIANNTVGTRLEYATHMHGAAQGRGDYLISTVRDAATASTLPDRVALYKAEAGVFEEQEVFTETCPGLHGSAQNENQIAFGCTDGVLVITQHGENFTAEKIANPTNFGSTMRVGTVIAADNALEFVGIAAGQFFSINTSTNQLTAINWIDAGTSPAPSAVSYDFADGGELFVILDNQGWLTLLDTSNWSVKHRIQVITSNLNALPTGSRFELALTPGHIAYVSDPIANQIKQVNLDEAVVSASIQLNFTPNKFTWLGIAEPEGSHH
jgi:hypothetical protein